jgi:hypothetical protein
LKLYDQIPVDVLRQYEGKWIVWDQDDLQVIAFGDTLDEAEDLVERIPTNHLLRVHHVLPADTEIAGML